MVYSLQTGTMNPLWTKGRFCSSCSLVLLLDLCQSSVRKCHMLLYGASLCFNCIVPVPSFLRRLTEYMCHNQLAYPYNFSDWGHRILHSIQASDRNPSLAVRIKLTLFCPRLTSDAGVDVHSISNM